ncbi:MAG: undecaprenyl-phosphate glucose phosphotransferase [Hyphomicrobiales bacterium]|nr:undecaprenyl-phosphate glucose phosphotransferase [Hyphomicrobiales bacterium]
MSDIPASNSGIQKATTGKRPSASAERRRHPRPKLADFRFQDAAGLISPVVVTGVVRLFEFVLVSFLGLAIFHAYLGGPSAFDGYMGYALYGFAILTAAGASSLSFQAFRLYDLSILSSILRQLPRIILAWTLVFAFLTAIAFFLKLGIEYSRIWVASWYLIGIAVLIGFRTLLASTVRQWASEGRLNRRAVIVGGGTAAEELISALEASGDTDIRIYGIFDDRNDARINKRISGYPKLGNIDELIEFGRKMRLDLLIVSLPITAENRLLQLLKKLWVLPVDICLSAHTSKLRFRPRAYSYIGNVPFVDVQDKPITDWDYVLKWIFDKVVATLILIAALPVMILVALAIKLDSAGPVFFKQKRYGFNNELIEVFKFRSMQADKSDQDAARLVTKNDSRVTAVGRFIRKTSLDELPQLFNVLKGELSLVGPRPHAMQAKAANALYDEVVDSYFARHRVKPGITGWAQISGWRGETDTEDKIQRRVEHDLFYIENWSIWFDLYILIRTPFSLLNTQNAY